MKIMITSKVIMCLAIDPILRELWLFGQAYLSIIVDAHTNWSTDVFKVVVIDNLIYYVPAASFPCVL